MPRHDAIRCGRQHDYCTIVAMAGELDFNTAPHLHEQLISLNTRGSYQHVFEIRRVGFVDCKGLGVLVWAYKRVHPHDGSIQVACNQAQVLEVLRLAELDQTFAVFSTRADAREAAQS